MSHSIKGFFILLLLVAVSICTANDTNQTSESLASTTISEQNISKFKTLAEQGNAKAFEWLTTSAKQGYVDAMIALEELEKQ